MVAFDWMATANSMRPHDFELLVRAYCKKQAARLRQNGEAGKDVQISFHATFDRNGEMVQGRWDLCQNWNDSTKGEILANVVDEDVRRHNWANGEKGKLLQIEG